MSTKSIISIRRISNDMKELTTSPLEGIGIVQFNNLFKYIINMELITGLYLGYKIQLLMTIPEDFPINPPKIEIFFGRCIKSIFHNHIFSNQLCINLLVNHSPSIISNDFSSGWNPVYSIKSVLIKVQNFISNLDFNIKSKVQPQNVINNLMNSMPDYMNYFEIIGNDENRIIISHSWKNQFPNCLNSEEDCKIKFIKENLTCYVLRDNYIDNKEIILGFPIVKSKLINENDKLGLYPIPKLLTYEGFQILSCKYQNPNSILNYFYTNSSIKVENNQYCNNWLPIFIDDEHFNKNRDMIINSLKIIKNENEFKVEQIFEIFPIILNKILIGIFNENLISEFIICYFHYFLLFKRLCQEYNKEYENYVNEKLNLIISNNFEVNKNIIPNIIDFFVLIYLSNKDINSSEMIKIRKALIEEFFTRQICWIFNDCKCTKIMKAKLSKCYVSFNDDNIINFLNNFNNKKNNENLDEILNYVYEFQNDNQLLLITFFTLKKIGEKDFMEELKKNYGIYFKVNEFVNELNQKLNEINTYKSLFNYIETEFGKDKTNLELIIEGYEKGKRRGYFKVHNEGRGRGYYSNYGYGNYRNYGYNGNYYNYNGNYGNRRSYGYH